MKRVFLLLLPLMGCEKQKFASSTPLPPQTRQAESVPLQISTRSLARARPDGQGSGQLMIKTSPNAEITCLDCPSNISLNFEGGAQNADGFADYAANFSYAFVRDTEVCPVQLRVRHASGRVDVVKYALYFCPVDLSLQVSKCEKPSARVICPI